MKGRHRIVIENSRIRYDFEVRRNLTIVRGDSATGKTTLVDMVGEFYNNGDVSGVRYVCDKPCAVLSGKDWEIALKVIKDSIVFIDEDNGFIASERFAAVIRETDNYYVLVTREPLPNLPYSVDEIYGIHNSGKYGTLKKTYNEFYRLYGSRELQKGVKPDRIIMEDSGSGFQFFDELCKEPCITCDSAQGKSNMFTLAAGIEEEETLLVADAAAFGPEMERVHGLLEEKRNLALYLPESFEWLLMDAGIVTDHEIKDILKTPEDAIESSEYFSWERFFTALLIKKTEGTYLRYNKSKLSEAYKQVRILDMVRKYLPVELKDGKKD